MINSKAVVYLTVSIIISGLLACSTVIADSKFQAIPGDTESVIAGVSIKYARDDRGCVKTCRFENDPARCGDEAQCCEHVVKYDISEEECRKVIKDSRSEYIECQKVPTPRIGGETVMSAGNTIATTQVCEDFNIVTHGSPGWVTTCTPAGCTVTCIGVYFPQWELCCDPWGCVRKP